MSMDLNLLPSQAKFQAKKNQLMAVIKRGSYIFGGFWLLALIMTFVWWKVSVLSLESSQKKYKLMLADYESLSEGAVLSEKIKYEAKLVGQVLKDRFEYGDSIARVSGLFSDKVTLGSVNLSGRDLFNVEGTIDGIEGSDEVEEKVLMINRGEIEGLASVEMKSLVWNYNFWNFGLEVKTK